MLQLHKNRRLPLIGFTLDEQAIIKYGTQWLETVANLPFVGYVEWAPEPRAASLALYQNASRYFAPNALTTQLHLPYFIDESAYAMNSITLSGQKTVKVLEQWLLFVEKLRLTSDSIPIILHPALQKLDSHNDRDITARYVELFLNLLEKLSLSRLYALALENIPQSIGLSFANRLDQLLAFREKNFNQQELNICLDLAHYAANGDDSLVPYDEIMLYHIHQASMDKGQDHKSLALDTYDFTPHYDALHTRTHTHITLELLSYAEPRYPQCLDSDLNWLSQRLKNR